MSTTIRIQRSLLAELDFWGAYLHLANRQEVLEYILDILKVGEMKRKLSEQEFFKSLSEETQKQLTAFLFEVFQIVL